MPTLFVMRSRFQPFLKQHYAALASLVREHKAQFEGGEALILMGVIRDYETLLRLHRPDVHLKVDDIDFRHLPLLNPLTTAEIIRDVRDGIEESIQLEEEESRQFLGSILSKYILISPIYVKFRDLAQILRDPDAVPDGFVEMLGAVPKNVNQRQVLRVLNCTVLDTLDRNLAGTEWQLVWVLPVVDNEDFQDWRHISRLTKNDGKARAVEPVLFPSDTPALTVHSLGTVSLGLYGIFACHMLSLLRGERGDGALSENDEIVRIVDRLVPTAIRGRFAARASFWVRKIAEDLSLGRRRTEEPFYLNEKIFRRSCNDQMAALNADQADRIMDWCSTNGTSCVRIGQNLGLVEKLEGVIEKLREMNLIEIYRAWENLALTSPNPYRTISEKLKLVVSFLERLLRVNFRGVQLEAKQMNEILVMSEALTTANTTDAFQAIELDEVIVRKALELLSKAKR